MSFSKWESQLQMNLEQDKVANLFDHPYYTIQQTNPPQFETIQRIDSMSTTQAATRFLKLKDQYAPSQKSSH